MKKNRIENLLVEKTSLLAPSQIPYFVMAVVILFISTNYLVTSVTHSLSDKGEHFAEVPMDESDDEEVVLRDSLKKIPFDTLTMDGLKKYTKEEDFPFIVEEYVRRAILNMEEVQDRLLFSTNEEQRKAIDSLPKPIVVSDIAKELPELEIAKDKRLDLSAYVLDSLVVSEEGEVMPMVNLNIKGLVDKYTGHLEVEDLLFLNYYIDTFGLTQNFFDVSHEEFLEGLIKLSSSFEDYIKYGGERYYQPFLNLHIPDLQNLFGVYDTRFHHLVEVEGVETLFYKEDYLKAMKGLLDDVEYQKLSLSPILKRFVDTLEKNKLESELIYEKAIDSLEDYFYSLDIPIANDD